MENDISPPEIDQELDSQNTWETSKHFVMLYQLDWIIQIRHLNTERRLMGFRSLQLTSMSDRPAQTTV